jgi:hypothetical protein
MPGGPGERPRPLGVTNKARFSGEEDQELLRLVKTYGTGAWAVVAQCMASRNTRQCRDRYNNYLNPTLCHREWSREEDELLMDKIRELGPKWHTIARHFQNRADIALRNRCHVLMRRNSGLLIAVGQKRARRKGALVSVHDFPPETYKIPDYLDHEPECRCSACTSSEDVFCF